MTDCSEYYVKGKLISMEDIPYWYIQFLATSPPDENTKIKAERELIRRGEE